MQVHFELSTLYCIEAVYCAIGFWIVRLVSILIPQSNKEDLPMKPLLHKCS